MQLLGPVLTIGSLTTEKILGDPEILKTCLTPKNVYFNACQNEQD